MTDQDKRRLDMLIRIRNFGAAHDQLFAASSTARAAFAAVATEVEQLETLGLTERLASHSARAARKAEARKALLDCLVRGRNTSRVLAKTNRDLAVELELPDVVDDRLLLTIARQFSAGVAPHAEPFAAHGITLQELDQCSDAFEAAVNERGMRRDEQVQTRARIESSMARALDAVETLDVIVANHLAGDPITLAAWKHDRRVTRPRRHRTTDTGTEPEVPPAPVSPAPTKPDPAPDTSIVQVA
jgi:hypothetical protein